MRTRQAHSDASIHGDHGAIRPIRVEKATTIRTKCDDYCLLWSFRPGGWSGIGSAAGFLQICIFRRT